jgi:hypothetical protein
LLLQHRHDPVHQGQLLLLLPLSLRQRREGDLTGPGAGEPRRGRAAPAGEGRPAGRRMPGARPRCGGGRRGRGGGPAGAWLSKGLGRADL